MQSKFIYMPKNSTDATASKETIKEIVQDVSSIFSSTNFIASCVVTFNDANKDEIVEKTIYFTKQDEEFVKMLNDYGARKSAELFNL